MGLTLSNKLYDRLRFVVQILIPALIVFYTAIAGIWGLGYATQVGGTLGAIAVFLGAILGLSRKNYTPGVDSYDGTLVINDTDPNKDNFTLFVDTPIEAIKEKTVLTLEIKKDS